MITLEVVGRSAGPVRFGPQTRITIGRGADNVLRIADGRVSTRHACIVFREGAWHFQDLRSTNGSMRVRSGEQLVVDGRRVIDAPLLDADTLLLGDVEDPITVQVGIAAAQATPAGEGTIVVRRPLDAGIDLEAALLGARGPGFKALAALLRRVGAETEGEAVFAAVAGFLLDMLPAANFVALVFAEAGRNAISVTRTGRTVVPVQADPPPWPRGLVTQALSSAEAVLAVDAADVDAERSLARFGASSALAVPLAGARNDRVGALVITAGQGGFSSADLDLAVALALQVGNSFVTADLVRRLRGIERRLRDENEYLKQAIPRDGLFDNIIGDSPAIKAVFEQMRLVKDTDVTVLINGETGTGKELVARALHDKSARARRLFAAVNCAALTESLLESELFGHVKGAFTGATDNKKGLFQVADGGTLFLDELGELSLKLQAKLLRVLQEGEVLPVGSTRPLKVDVRVVAATHRNLQAMAGEGTFRQDLFYRINVFPIRVPPLRERGSDVTALAAFFIDRYAKRFGKHPSGLTEACATALVSFDFPGNIRQLENEVQRAVLLTPDGQAIDARVLSQEVQGGPSGNGAKTQSGGATLNVAPGVTLKATMEGLEREVLRRVLEELGWNRSEAARRLGLSRQALMAKLSRYTLKPD
ncbi:MAG: transcriptional regulator with GAF, ATPase, and Fis domain [Myxococcota bacterium]|jgi:transcriptional regulator with GAF, ATPase, and Fis domain